MSKHVTKSPEVDVFASRVLVKNDESCDLQLVSQITFASPLRKLSMPFLTKIT